VRIFILLIVFPLLCSADCTQAQPGASDSKRGDGYARRDLALEREALAQRIKIDDMLPSWAKQKLNSVFKAFLNRLLRDQKPIDLSELVKAEMERQFTGLSSLQSNILTFYVLAGVIKLIPPHSDRTDTGSEKESIGEISQTDMLMLQQMMEKKNQLETMISNVMKAGFEGGQAAIQALKAS
jgi:hypothetical protein